MKSINGNMYVEIELRVLKRFSEWKIFKFVGYEILMAVAVTCDAV